MDYIVHGVEKSQTQLSDFHSLQAKGVEFLWGTSLQDTPSFEMERGAGET